MRAPGHRGCFLTFEGVDGAGKSSHIDWVCAQLRERGLTVVTTREPGGTPLGERLRDVLLHHPMTLRAETLLMFAARAEHLATVIEPALARGDWVVCDRFTDATFAYQGGGRQLGAEAIAVLERWVQGTLQPDRTWFFDLPLAVARQRLQAAREADRFEREDAAFFERTRAAYQARAAADPGRIVTLDAAGDLAAVRSQLARDLTAFLEARHV